MNMSVPVIYTIGHSTRTLEEFIQILQAYGVTRLVDVRTLPGSRHNPQFNLETLPAALQTAGIAYSHLPGLGGLRRPRPDSPNAAWKNDSFRGFADYMQTSDFDLHLRELLRLAAGSETLALMCAEAVPWRCHRSLIGDALQARGQTVVDILDLKHSQPHRLTPFAVVDGERVTYPKTDV